VLCRVTAYPAGDFDMIPNRPYTCLPRRSTAPTPMRKTKDVPHDGFLAREPREFFFGLSLGKKIIDMGFEKGAGNLSWAAGTTNAFKRKVLSITATGKGHVG